jgi:hypothetical protein
MISQSTRTSLFVAGLIALSFTGCASGKLRITGQKLCESEGGTYNKVERHCTYPTQPRSAKASCEAKGGYYDVAADVCELGLE